MVKEKEFYCEILRFVGEDIILPPVFKSGIDTQTVHHSHFRREDNILPYKSRDIALIA